MTLPKEEYDELLTKARLFDHYVKTEELSEKELEQIRRDMKGPFMTKAQFLKKHPELN